MRLKPAEVHRLHGTYRPHRHAGLQPPAPPPGRPTKPRHLTGIAADEWRRLAQLASKTGVLTSADGPALEAAALAYADMRRAHEVIERDGHTYSTRTATGSEMQRARPEVAIAAEAWRRYVAGLGHLGLTPATRPRVRTAPEAEKPDPFDLVMKRLNPPVRFK